MISMESVRAHMHLNLLILTVYAHTTFLGSWQKWSMDSGIQTHTYNATLKVYPH